MSSDYLAWQQQDFYALLGVTRMASEDEIRKAFRARARECHPDRFPLDSPEQAEAEKRFKELMLARDTLLDLSARADYDRQQDLVQQAWLDAVVYQVPVQKKPPASTAFGDLLRQVYQQYQTPEASRFNVYDQPPEEVPETVQKGVPEPARKNAAAFYYSQGIRLAAQGQFRRALHALNSARMLDPELEIEAGLLNRVRTRAWYSKG